MTDPAAPIPIPLDATRLADFVERLVEIRIDDPVHRLGRRPIVRLHRPGRSPAILERPVLLDRRGRGRHLGWMPDELSGIDVVADSTGILDGAPPTVRVRRIGEVEMVVWAALRRPRRLLRILRLLHAGNRKGAEFRFARLFDDIAAPSYRDWLAVQTESDVADAEALDLSGAPRLLVAIGPGSSADRAATRADLDRERGVSVVVIDPLVGPPPAEPGDLLLRLPAGTRLTRGALHHLVAPFLDDDPPIVVHCDEDRLSASGRRVDPMFAPVWDPLSLAAGAVPMTAAVVRRDRPPPGMDPIGTPAAVLLPAAVAERRDAVVHVPRVLVHVPGPPPPVVPTEAPRLAEAERPAVSVVIPTRDRADLLERCLDGLRHRTSGVDLDIVIVDNGSVEARTRTLFEECARDPRIRILAAPGPFDFAGLNNLGVAATRHDLVLLLNNDVEPIDADWLRAMVAEISDPSVGAVGARLLFPDGHVQHGGVAVGAGTVARHAFHFYRLDGGEDRGRLALRREMSSVTAACLLTRRTAWDAVGGMAEGRLTVAFNDVDYCLGLRARGFRVIWTPVATLIHRESVSRGADDTPEKRARFATEEAYMEARWGATLADDPFESPNLARFAEAFVLAAAPRRVTPRRASWSPHLSPAPGGDIRNTLQFGDEDAYSSS